MAYLLGGVVLVVVAIVRFIAANFLAIVLVTLAAASLWGLSLAVDSIGRRRIDEYLSLCQELATRGTLDPNRAARMNALARKVSASSQPRLIGEETIYRGLIGRVLADGQIDEHERRVMDQLEQLFEFDAVYADTIRQEGFAGLLTTLRGHLDANAEQHARRIAQDLRLRNEDVERHLRPLIEQRNRALQAHREETARQAEAERRQAEREAKIERDYRLASDVWEAASRPATTSAVRLSRGESAWFETPAVAVKRLKKGDERTPGRLLVTDRRLLFVAAGTTSIRLNRVLDVAAEFDDGVLHVVKDGRQRPYLFEVEQPLLAKAHVERSLAELA